MNGFIDDIEKLTKENSFFRQVLFTGEYCQLVLMSLKPGEEIGKEVHESVDQFFRVDGGKGEVYIDGETKEIKDGFAVVVPAGSEHNIVNTGSVDLKLYTIYSPPNHPDGTIHKTHKEAMEAEEHEHGKD
jgi:mannose-6-phosphate isomerase-like protein (cupin superfamily)